MKKLAIIAILACVLLVSGCTDQQTTDQTTTQSQQTQPTTPADTTQKEVDIEVLSISCENTDGDPNIPNDYGASCEGKIINRGYKIPRHVKIKIDFYDADDNIVGTETVQPNTQGGELLPNYERDFEAELEIKRPYERFAYEASYPEEFVTISS